MSDLPEQIIAWPHGHFERDADCMSKDGATQYIRKDLHDDEITRLRAQVAKLKEEADDAYLNGVCDERIGDHSQLDALLEKAVKAALEGAIDIVREDGWKGLSLHHLRTIDPAAIVQKVKAK